MRHLLRLFMFIYLVSIAATLGFSTAKISAAEVICAQIIVVLPISRRMPLAEHPARFELRQCTGSVSVQVLQFESGQQKPVKFIDLHEPWRLLFHASNVLVIQNVGGSSSIVYVLHFRNGRAQAPRLENTKGTAHVRIDSEAQKVLVDVPPDVRPTVTIAARSLEYPLE